MSWIEDCGKYLQDQVTAASNAIQRVKDQVSEAYRIAVEQFNQIRDYIVGIYNSAQDFVAFLEAMKKIGKLTPQIFADAKNRIQEFRSFLKRAFPKFFPGV